MRKNNLLMAFGVLFFLVATFSVTIADILWDHYFAILLLELVFLTVYASIFLDNNKRISDNKFNFILMLFISASSLIFCVINDVLHHAVYKYNSFNFLSIWVMITQTVGIVGIIYNVALFWIDSFKKANDSKEVIVKPIEKEHMQSKNNWNNHDVDKIVDVEDSSNKDHENEEENSESNSSYLIEELPSESRPFMDKEK